MWIILAVVLLVAYVVGLVTFKAAGFAIHLLLIFAIISFILHFVLGRRAA